MTTSKDGGDGSMIEDEIGLSNWNIYYAYNNNHYCSSYSLFTVRVYPADDAPLIEDYSASVSAAAAITRHATHRLNAR